MCANTNQNIIAIDSGNILMVLLYNYLCCIVVMRLPPTVQFSIELYIHDIIKKYLKYYFCYLNLKTVVV